jgi:hypothetical protein
MRDYDQAQEICGGSEFTLERRIRCRKQARLFHALAKSLGRSWQRKGGPTSIQPRVTPKVKEFP